MERRAKLADRQKDIWSLREYELEHKNVNNREQPAPGPCSVSSGDHEMLAVGQLALKEGHLEGREVSAHTGQADTSAGVLVSVEASDKHGGDMRSKSCGLQRS